MQSIQTETEPPPPNRLLDLLVDDIGSVLATGTEEADGEKEERTEDSKQKHSSHKPLKHSSHKAFAEALESQPKIPQKPIMTSQGEISPSPKEQPLSRPHPLARRVSYGGTRNVLSAYSTRSADVDQTEKHFSTTRRVLSHCYDKIGIKIGSSFVFVVFDFWFKTK